MKTLLALLLVLAMVFPLTAGAQVNSGSNGSDGAFNPTASVEIDMANHPDGIYQYTSVNIPSGVTVTFKPNAQNKPVVWLVQGDCVIGGELSVSAPNWDGSNLAPPSAFGPGGWSGGVGGSAPGNGKGPGGGYPSIVGFDGYGGPGSFSTVGQTYGVAKAGQIYGSTFLIPLIGGSGGAVLITTLTALAAAVVVQY